MLHWRSAFYYYRKTVIFLSGEEYFYKVFTLHVFCFILFCVFIYWYIYKRRFLPASFPLWYLFLFLFSYLVITLTLSPISLRSILALFLSSSDATTYIHSVPLSFAHKDLKMQPLPLSERDAATETADQHSRVSSAILHLIALCKNCSLVVRTLTCPLQKHHIRSTCSLTPSATLSHYCRVEKKDKKKKTTDAPAAPLLWLYLFVLPETDTEREIHTLTFHHMRDRLEQHTTQTWPLWERQRVRVSHRSIWRSSVRRKELHTEVSLR